MLKSKMSILTGIVHRIRGCLNIDSIRQIYLSLIYPHLIYCCSLWGGACNTFLNKIFVAQKKLLRVMSYKHRYDHTHTIFKNLRLLKFPDILQLQTYLFVHKSIYSFPVKCGFTATPRSAMTLRRTHDLLLPRCRTSHAKHSVLSRGTKAWNDLPNDLKLQDNVNSFKCQLIKRIYTSYDKMYTYQGLYSL